MREIARLAGVSQPAVSAILNNRDNTIKVSEATRQNVLRVIRETGYLPNATGRALSTRRTNYIGFLLSDAMTGGWTNAFFTKIFSGVEQACRERGYGMHASLYNLTNVDSFVFPAKVGQRSVDGLVLTGYVEAAVVARFREFGIPCVCIGDNLEVAELIPTVTDDMIGGILQALEYLAGLGHIRIGYCPGPTRRGLELGNMIVRRAGANGKTSHCRVRMLEFNQWADYNLAPVLLDTWLGIPVNDRSTAILASDQTVIGLLKEMSRRGLACPRDISLVAGGNTNLCEYSIPGLTAIDCDLEGMGKTAVYMLVDHLENGNALMPAMSRSDFRDHLIVRESCGSPSEEKEDQCL